jgi:aspartyl/asparaginyl beta-hydroxylase (cupin superfamily)
MCPRYPSEILRDIQARNESESGSRSGYHSLMELPGRAKSPNKLSADEVRKRTRASPGEEPPKLPLWIRKPRKRFARLLKRRGRPTLNDFLARYSLLGDPEVFDPADFPWVSELESHWKGIRDEAEAMLALRPHIPAFQEVSPDQYRISDTDEWKTFWYRGFGHRSEVFARLCPETARCVDAVPGLETAFFSIVASGKHIIPHRGVSKGIVNCHLGLMIPYERERCRMRVGTSHFHWLPGRCRVFDDTFEHEVWNEADEERVVLMLQFRRPLREPGRTANRLFLAAFARTDYVTVAKRNQIAWERRLEEILQSARLEDHGMDAKAGGTVWR